MTQPTLGLGQVSPQPAPREREGLCHMVLVA